LLGVSIILFAIMRLAPGGPEAVLIGGEFSQEAAAEIRQRLGLERPLALQYVGWASAALHGDLGPPFQTRGSLRPPIIALLRPAPSAARGHSIASDGPCRSLRARSASRSPWRCLWGCSRRSGGARSGTRSAPRCRCSASRFPASGWESC